MKYSNLALITILTIFVAACGGGGGGGGGIGGVSLNEGSESAPVSITVGQTRVSTVGVLGTSYYTFQTTLADTATIRLTNTHSDLSWELYRDSAFTDWVMVCDDPSFNAVDEICTTPPLTNATRYYLLVDEWELVSDTFNLQVTQP